MRRATALALALSALAAACRMRAPETKPVPAVVASVAATDAAATAPLARTDGQPKIGAVDQIYFSTKGRLAFLVGADAFAVVDTRSGRVHRFAGTPPRSSTLGFDNRCDVSRRGYMPNVDVWYAPTSAAEEVFVRSARGDKGPSIYRDELLPDGSWRSLVLPGPGAAAVYASITTVADASYVAHGATAIVKAPADTLIDSDDARPKSAFVWLHHEDVFLLDPLDAGANKKTFHVAGATGILESWVSFDRRLLTTVTSTGDGRKFTFCAHELADGKSNCAPFVMPDSFFRQLVSDDGNRIAFTERVRGKTSVDPHDEYQRETSKDACFLHVLDRRTGKDARWTSVCTTTTEMPLRFEGDTLVTDVADIVRCERPIFRRYDLARPAAPPTRTLGPAASEDVDDKLLAAIKKKPEQAMLFVEKQRTWPGVYGLDDLVTWSEGASVLARKGSALVLCKKRGGACGPSLATLGDDVVGGASRDGTLLAAATTGHFLLVDATTGAKKLDVSYE